MPNGYKGLSKRVGVFRGELFLLSRVSYVVHG